MKAWRKVWGPIGLSTPARRATRRTMRRAPWRSMRWPLAPKKMGPASRSPTARSTARAVRGARGHGYDLATLAQDGERAVAPLEPEGLDVGADSFRDPQAVQCQQRNERVLDRRPQPSRDEQGAHFVASRPMAWLSWSKRGRRTWTAGETGTSPSSSA